ncbi:MAG: T9SS type A sorting domain-containing protein, partial [Bacteroidota bacterium]
FQNLIENNMLQFNLQFGGLRDDSFMFHDLGESAWYWTSTEYNQNYCWFRLMIRVGGNGIYRGNGLGTPSQNKNAGFSVRCVKETISSIHNTDSNSTNILIYPNPTKGNIQIKGEEVLNIDVLDITGKHLTGFKNLSGLNKIDLSTQAKGIYIIKITSKNGFTVEKIILE